MTIDDVIYTYQKQNLSAKCKNLQTFGQFPYREWPPLSHQAQDIKVWHGD